MTKTKAPRLTGDAAEFARILRRQLPGGVESEDWEDCGALKVTKRDGDVHIELPYEVVFVFRKGRLVGLYNYKQ